MFLLLHKQPKRWGITARHFTSALAPPTIDKDRKRKRVVLFGYDGSPFNGSQTQRNERHVDMALETVEDALHLALYRAGAISDANFSSLQKIAWSRSSRTDRGVHAATQIVCAKLVIPDCEEDAETGHVSRQDEANFCDRVNSLLHPSIRVYRIQRVQNGFNARTCTTSRRYSYFLPEFVLGERASEHTLARLQAILACFVGTHSFHNYTEGMSPMDPRAMRYIKSFTATQHSPGVIHLQVSGQSFLKHHIRRMVGFAAACLRYDAKDAPGLVHASLRTDRVCAQLQLKMPFAPAEPLFLDMMFLEQYNNKAGQAALGNRESIDFEEESVSKQRDALVRELILPVVFSKYEAVFKEWVSRLDEQRGEFPPAFVEPDLKSLEQREAKRKAERQVEYIRPR